jgi:hypothetical protein
MRLLQDLLPGYFEKVGGGGSARGELRGDEERVSNLMRQRHTFLTCDTVCVKKKENKKTVKTNRAPTLPHTTPSLTRQSSDKAVLAPCQRMMMRVAGGGIGDTTAAVAGTFRSNMLFLLCCSRNASHTSASFTCLACLLSPSDRPHFSPWLFS